VDSGTLRTNPPRSSINNPKPPLPCRSKSADLNACSIAFMPWPLHRIHNSRRFKSALQLPDRIESIADLARFLFSFFPAARPRAGQRVLAIAINVQPLYTVASSPIRPVSLCTAAIVARVDLYSGHAAPGFQWFRLKRRRAVKVGTDFSCKHTGITFCDFSQSSISRKLAQTAPLERRKAP
jgi:hypothetical protein